LRATMPPRMATTLSLPAFRRVRVLRLALVVGSLALIAFATFVYSWSLMVRAAGKPMWLDEYFALTASVRQPSLLGWITQGVPNQGSPSPLDYLFVRALDATRFATGFFGLPPHTYYRLVSIVAIVASGIAGVVVAVSPSFRQFAGRPPWVKFAAAATTVCCLVAYWFQPFALEYGTQMRPYALWLALSFVAYAVALRSDSRWWLMTAWLAVAATATASLFQIATLALACTVVDTLRGRTWRDIAKDSLLPLAVPLVVAGYYALRAGKWHYWGPEWGTWRDFFSFFYGWRTVAFLSGAGVGISMLRPDTRRFAVPCLAMLLLYAAAPLIYFVTRQRGFFFTNRQYVYYDLAGPLFMLTAVRCLATIEARSRQALALAAILCVGCPLITARLIEGGREPKAAWRAWRAGRWPTFPTDPEGTVARTLRGGSLPRAFCLADEGATEGSVRNLELVAEWVPVHYRNPIGQEIVYVVSEGDGARVRSDHVAICTGPHYVAVHARAQ